MRNRYKALSILLFLSLVVTVLSACSNEEASKQKEGGKENGKDGEVTLKVLINWNGSEAGAPADEVNNPIAQKIKEETGVVLDFEYTKQSEVEKINQIFATGDLPDIYAGPAWGQEAETLLKAANDGQLHDLTKELEKYPNLQKLVKKENMARYVWDNTISKQKGGQFMLHVNYPATPEDNIDWLYGLYVRKDIAEKIGIDPQSVRTPEDVYNFLKAIKEGNFKENGQPVFPLGAFHGGWALGVMQKMFYNNWWIFDEDKNAELNFMSKEYEEMTLFYRKLISEGLIDKEAYIQTAATSNEKAAQGRYAVIAALFPAVYGATRPFVDEHPEAEYVPVGPLNDANGDPYRTEFNVQGNNLVAIPKTSDKLEAAMRVLDYLASDEGFILTHYGIEGVHYEKVDGKIEAKKGWAVDKIEEDPDALRNEGIGISYNSLTGLDRTYSLGGGPFGYQYNPQFKLTEKYKKIVRPEGYKPIKGEDINVIFKAHQNYEQLKPIMDQLGDVWEQAIYSKSDKEALRLLDESREALKSAGIEDVAKEISKAVKDGRDLIQYSSAN